MESNVIHTESAENLGGGYNSTCASNTHLSTDFFLAGKNSELLFSLFSLVCILLSTNICLSIMNLNEIPSGREERCVFDHLKNRRLENPKKVMLGHLNINSIPKKFEGIMDLVKGKLDIFLISETKIDTSFPDEQFCCEGYSIPHRKDRILGGGCLLMYVNENIPSRLLNEHNAPTDIELR